jgi:zinc-ribbon domain
MAQSPRTCPNCGTVALAGQRFCSNCGNDLSRVEAAGQYAGPPPPSFPQAQPPPPYIPPYVPPYAQQQYQQPQQQKSNLLAEVLGALGLLFFLRRYRPGYTPRRQSSGCCGCLVALVILALVLGIPGYIAYKAAGPGVINQLQNNGSTGSNGSTGNNNGGILTTQPPAAPVTTQLNETVNYAGVDITIVNAQQARSFSDDNNSSAHELLRLNLKEKAGSAVSAFFYSDVMRLVLPDKTTIVPSSEQFGLRPDQETSRTNWIDFAVPTNIKIDQLTLLLGTDKEAQMSIPLSSSANLSAYHPKTASPNASTQYAGLSWTITSATLAWNYNGKQADKGMRYVVVQFRIDNPTSHQFISGFPGDYMRLKAGNATSAPDGSTTLPTVVPANSTGATGVVPFQVPEGVTSYTLILLANSNVTPPIAQVSMDFQIR